MAERKLPCGFDATKLCTSLCPHHENNSIFLTFLLRNKNHPKDLQKYLDDAEELRTVDPGAFHLTEVLGAEAFPHCLNLQFRATNN